MKNKNCVFPFQYLDGSVHYECTDIEHHRLWCATEVDSEGKIIEENDKWGNCGSCDIVFDRSIATITFTTTTTNTTKTTTKAAIANKSPITSKVTNLFQSSTVTRLFSIIPKANHKEICGRRFAGQPRIMGGELFGGISTYGEWPWQVTIRFFNIPNKIILVHCFKNYFTLLWNEIVIQLKFSDKATKISNLILTLISKVKTKGHPR